MAPVRPNWPGGPRDESRYMSRTTLFASAAIVACLTLPGLALAQEKSSKPAAAKEVEEIVVTGSRIPQQNIDQPTPVSMLTNADIQKSGAINLGDVISQIPALGFVGSIRGGENGGQGSGLDIPNLRNLGAQRTLTLVDGQRHVPGAAGAAGVDLNSIPPTLVDHVEVTTGGSSAIYGSDAVTGVVNIITKKHINGVQADVSYGAASGGFDKSVNVAFSVGRDFADDRGNAAFSLIWDHSDAVSSDNVKGLKNAGTIVNFADCATPRALSSGSPCTPKPNDGIPDSIIVNNVGSELIGRNGVLIIGGAGGVNIGFDASGNPVAQPLRTGYSNNAFGQLPFPCGSCFFGQDFVNILPEITRKGFFSNVSYELTPAIQFTLDAKYVRTENNSIFQPSFVFGSISPNDGSAKTFSTQIAPDNAFRTAAINTFINNAVGTNRSASSLTYADFIGPARGDTTTRDTTRVVAGLNGKFDLPAFEVHYDTALNYGQTDNSFVDHGQLLDGNFRASLDSVIDPATGKPACRINVPSAQSAGYVAPTGITQLASACVPYNPFGQSNGPAFFKWAEATLSESQKITQEVANANFRVNTSRFFNLPGGPIDAAFGAEYRRETSVNTNDPLALQGLTFRAAAPTAPGHFSVYESYLELRAPILKHRFLAEELTVGGAVRQAKYQPFGSVNTWNANFVYEPFEHDLTGWRTPLSGLRFRGTASSATRAPNIDEAYRPISPGFANITDPCDAQNIGLNVNRVANCAALSIPAIFHAQTAQSINTVTSGGLVNGTGALRNETAHTYTLGLTYQPGWLTGVVFTMDYYNINILNAITLPPAQTIINNCVDATALNPQFCNLVARLPSTDPAKAFNIQSVTAQFLNAAGLRTHGVDFQLGYAHDVSDWTQHLGPLQKLDGRIRASVDANWTQANRTIPFAQFPKIQNINEARLGLPTERGTLDLSYSQGDWTVGWRSRYVSRTVLFNRDATQIEHCESISPCQIKATAYSDINVSYKLMTQVGDVELFGGVKNIFNHQIPLGGFTTNAEYEIFGTTGFVGVRLRQ